MKDLKEAKRIKSCEVVDLATQGVQRALAARKTALELTPAQTEEVSGGASASAVLSKLSIHGGRVGPIFDQVCHRRNQQFPQCQSRRTPMNSLAKIKTRTNASLLRMTIVGLVVVGVAASAAPAEAAVYTVLNNGDMGIDSLRWAIRQANMSAGVDDEIQFNIPGGGTHVITLTTDLPRITDKVEIKGYTQPGAVKATVGVPAVIKIVIDASMVSNGLVLATDDSAVRGIIVRSASGLLPDGVGIRVVGNRNHISGNILGITPGLLGPGGLPPFSFGNEGDGVQVEGDDNVVGGLGPEDRNVITGNGLLHQTGAHGVSIVGNRNRVRGNTIGMDQIGNDRGGVRLMGDDNHVGGTAPGAANLIASNGGAAVLAETGTGNAIENNLIGTDGTGMAAIGNSRGVVIESSHTVLAGNVIAATTTGPGVEVIGNHNTVQGNKVGTDAVAGAALPNFGGIRVYGNENTIGGRQDGEGNVVSGNLFYGIAIRPVDPADPAVRNVVEGNLIGTNGGGNGPLPNDGDGIEIADSDNNTIGGNSAGAGNTIAHNAGNGVNVESGARNTILGNSIAANDALGIDLADDGTTLNDVDDGDGGANGLQNHPEITSATAVVGGGTSIDWTLNSKPSSTYLVEFYLNNVCDSPSGHGEGKVVLGTLQVTTDAVGNAAGTFVPQTTGTVGLFVVATATVTEEVAAVITEFKATSEFSACTVVL